MGYEDANVVKSGDQVKTSLDRLLAPSQHLVTEMGSDTEEKEQGLWVMDSDGDRDSALVEAFLRGRGFPQAALVSSFPRSGLVLLMSNRVAGQEDRALKWVRQGPNRRVLLEPTCGALRDGWPRLVLGQRRLCPAPDSSFDDSYLSDLIEIGWYGLEARRDRLPDSWIAYVRLLGKMLADRSDRPEEVLARSRVFSRHTAVQDPMYRYLRDRLEGGAIASPPASGDPLLYHAHRVAAEDDPDSWRTVLDHLDRRRGLFRRSLDAPPGRWQLHPVVLCAVARKIRRHPHLETECLLYPEPPVGPGPAADGRWVECECENVFRLRGSLLTDVARVMDPPALPYPYDFSEWSEIPPREERLLRELEQILPDGVSRRPLSWPEGRSFCLCIRHDVDRPLTRGDMERQLELEGRLSARSSWYFKRETFDRDLAGELLRRGCEVGYHSELLQDGDEGFAGELGDWLGSPPGVTFHGGLGSEGWRGRRSFEDVLRLGLHYAELPVGLQARPSFWTNGERLLPLTPLPVKFDVFPERVEGQTDWLVRLGGMLIVENHPDRCESSYCRFLEELAAKNPARFTVREALEAALPHRE